MNKGLLFIICFIAQSLAAFSQKQPAKKQLEKGKILARNCINCHGTTTAALADPLLQIRKIRSADYIYKLMQNPMKFADENKTAKKVFAKRGLQMPSFANLSKNDINAILDYFDSLAYNPVKLSDLKKN